MAKFVLTAQLELQAPKNATKVVSDIQRQLQGVTVPVEVKNAASVAKQIDKVSDATKRAGSAAEAMGRSFGLAVKRFAAFTVASRAVSLFTNSLAGAIDEAIAFQREVVRVSQVTGKSVKDLRGLTDTITRLSTTLGTSSKELLSTATVLAQAGIQAQDLNVALEALAKTTLAPNFDSITETAEGAVAILAQFGLGVGALEKQLSSVNAVAGAFAVESEDLIGAIRRFGGVFKASGGSLEELLAVFTSVRATTRESAESISTGLRTIFTRIQRPKTIEFLKQFGVELTTLDGKFVGPFEAAKRLADAFGNLDQGDITFIRVAEELGGFRQIGKVIPLLQQFALAQEALNVAQEGSDSLTKDAATAQQALAVQITKVKEEFLALVRSIADSSSFQLFARTALEIASSLIKVADAVKPLIPLLATLAAFKFAQGLGSFASSAGAAIKGLGTLGGIPQGKNQGGKILAFARGGMVPGTGNRDTVPAMLSPGEFVIRKSSVNKIGAGTLAAMNENRYAGGGVIKVKNPEKYGAFVLDSKSGSPIAQNPVEMSSSANLKANELLTKANITEAGQARGKGNQEKYQIQGPFPVFGIGATQSIQSDFQAEFSKASESAITAGADAILKSNVSKALDIGPFKGSDNFEFNIQDVLKGAKSTIEGYLLEAVVGSVGGLKAGTDKPAGSSSYADFDFPNIGAEGAAARLQKLFDPNETISNLKKADAKRQRATAADSDKGLHNKVLKDLNVGDFDFIPAASGVGDKALLDYAKGLTSQERKSFKFPAGSAENLKKLPTVIDRQALENAYNANVTQKALGGLIQKFEKGGKVIVAAEANSKLQGSHIGGDVVLDNAQLAEVFKATNNIKLKRSILNRYKGVDTSKLSADEVHKKFAATDISASEIDDLKSAIGLQLKYPTKLNFPSIYNQALRETDPRLVAKDDLSKFISGSTKLVSPISGSANKSDQLSSTLNKPEVLSGIKTSLISQLRSIPTSPENTINGIETYDSDTELNSLQPAFINAVKSVKSELAESLTSKADFIFKGGQKLTSKGKLRSSQDRFQAVIPQAKMLGGVIQKFAKAGIVKKGEQASGVGIFDSDMVAGGTAIKKAILDKIKTSGKQYEVITGPAGSGKTTMATARFGKNFVLSDADVGNYDRFVVLSGAAKTKTGDFSDEVQSLLSGASKISVLAPDAERILQQRQGRIDAALAGNVPDQRSTGALQGTMKAPTEANEELFKKYKNVEILRKYASGGPAPSDTVPALLTPGEFVINKSAAQNIGYGNLNRMNKQGVTGFAKGGAVGIQTFGDGGSVQEVDTEKPETNFLNKALIGITASVAAAQLALEAFGDKSLEASDEQAALTIGTEKAIAAFAQVSGIIAITSGFRKSIKEWSEATADSGNKQSDNTETLSASVDKAINNLQNIDTTTIKANKVVTEATASGAADADGPIDQLGAGGDPEVKKLMMGVLEGKTFKNKKEEESAQVDDLIKGVEAGTEGVVARKERPEQNAAASVNAQAEMQKKQAEISKASARSNVDAAKSAIIGTQSQIKTETANQDEMITQSYALKDEESGIRERNKTLRQRAGAINDQASKLKEQRKNVGSIEELEAIDAALRKLQTAAIPLKKELEENKNQFYANRDAQAQLKQQFDISTQTVSELQRDQQKYNQVLQQSRSQLGVVAATVDKFGFAARKATIAFKDTSGFKAASSAFSAASSGVKKLTNDIKNLAAKAKAGVSGSFAPGGAGRAIAGQVGMGLTSAAGIVTSIAAVGSQIASGFEEWFKRSEEQARASDNIAGAIEAAGQASTASSFGELFTIGGAIQAFQNPDKFAENMVTQQNTAEFQAASSFIGPRTQKALEQISKGEDSGRAQAGALEAFAKARSEAGDLKGVAREQANAQLDSQSRDFIKSLDSSGASLTDLKNAAISLGGGNEKLTESLKKQVEVIEKTRKAQEELNKANFDALKLTSAFGAAADASARLVAGLETGADSLDLYSQELESATGRVGVDASKAINAAEKELLSSLGPGADASTVSAVRGQAAVARTANQFGVNVGAELTDLKISPGEAGKQQIEDALIKAIPDDADAATRDKLEAVIAKNVAAIEGDPRNADLSALVKKISEDGNELSAGFREAVKLQSQHNQTMSGLYQKREALEQKAAEAANQAIETQLEAAKIFEEFGGAKLTGQQQLSARVAQFNNIGGLGGLGAQLTTGNASDIRSVAQQIGTTFADQTDQFIGGTLARATGQVGAGPFGGAGGFAADKRPEAEAANKALIQFTKQRIDLLKEELSIVQKKNAEEKSALESLISGDVESFLDKQAAAGAGAALATGSAGLTGLFSASALGAGFKTLEGQGLDDKQLRQAENLTLQRFGIQSTGVLSGTTTQEEALKSQGRELAGVLGELSQQEAAFAQAEFQVNNATITAAQLSFDRALSETTNRANVGQQMLARGGIVYASRGMFIPRGTDTVPAMLTPGEFVVNRAAVQRGNNLQILRAMNSGGGASAPGAMSGGGKVQYYSDGGGVMGSIANVFGSVLPQLTTVFTDFSATVEKLVGFKFQVTLDPTNINLNFNGTSFMSTLEESLKQKLTAFISEEISKNGFGPSGDLKKKPGVLP